MHRVAHNEAFLKETLQGTIQVDEFTGNLFKIWETVLDEGVKQVSQFFASFSGWLLTPNSGTESHFLT